MIPKYEDIAKALHRLATEYVREKQSYRLLP